jgi:hypothetical protein
MLRVRSLLLACTLCFLVVLTSGCGQRRRVTVKGTLVLPANVQLAEKDTVRIVFAPEDSGIKGARAKFNPSDKSFVATGVPTGKNKVTVAISPYQKGAGSEQHAKDLDVLNQAYGGPKTPLSYEVSKDPEQSITIDVSTISIDKRGRAKGAGTITKK